MRWWLKILTYYIDAVAYIDFCSQKEEQRQNYNQNEIISTNEVEIKDTDLIKENKVEDNYEDRKGDSDSSAQIKLSQLANSNILSNNDLHVLFKSTYEEALSERDEPTIVNESSFFKFTGEYPMISFNYESSLYYLNSNYGSCLVMWKLTRRKRLRLYLIWVIKKEMTLSDILKLDSTLKVNEIWTGYSDFHHYYVEVIVDEF